MSRSSCSWIQGKQDQLGHDSVKNMARTARRLQMLLQARFVSGFAAATLTLVVLTLVLPNLSES
ncbi:MAG: hypothetical protein VXY07_14655, partial [Planctomycetota bacterium]|nr:hypothetical protein [Planctomycetota bacterium]